MVVECWVSSIFEVQGFWDSTRAGDTIHTWLLRIRGRNLYIHGKIYGGGLKQLGEGTCVCGICWYGASYEAESLSTWNL